MVAPEKSRTTLSDTTYSKLTEVMVAPSKTTSAFKVRFVFRFDAFGV